MASIRYKSSAEYRAAHPERYGSSSHHSSSSSSGSSRRGSGGYDKNKDYSLAIQQAQKNGASQSYLNQLRQERQNKIDAQYGGNDPYRGSHNIMGNQGSSSGSRPSSSGSYVNEPPRRPNSGSYVNTPPRPSSNGYSGYDQNKDYSLAIQQAQQNGASQAYIDQLRQERQNKINAQYNGRDPYRGNGDIMGNRGGSSGGSGNGLSDRPQPSSPWLTSPKVSYGPGMARPGVKNDRLAGGADYANKRVALGDWTYIFDERGRQIGKVKDYGRSANGTVKTTHANDSYAHQMAYQAAQRGDMDGMGHWLNQIAMAGGTDEYGNYDMTSANHYGTELQMEFPQLKNFYRNQYDKVYGAGAWDDPNHDRNSGDGPHPYYRDMAIQNQQSGAILPSGPIGNLPDWQADHYAPSTGLPRPSGGGYPAYPGGGSQWEGSWSGQWDGGYRDDGAEAYLRELYHQKQLAEEARLKADFDADRAGLLQQQEALDALYDRQRNQAAAEHELERLHLGEMGAAHGLNTGAFGQLALGESMGYLGSLSQLNGLESAAHVESGEKLQQLESTYRSALRQSSARNESELLDKLYREYVRQSDAADKARREAQSQARWEMQRMDAIARREEEAEERRWQSQQREEAAADSARQKALSDKARILAGYGDFSGYAALGYTDREIASMEAGWRQKHPPKTSRSHSSRGHSSRRHSSKAEPESPISSKGYGAIKRDIRYFLHEGNRNAAQAIYDANRRYLNEEQKRELNRLL